MTHLAMAITCECDPLYRLATQSATSFPSHMKVNYKTHFTLEVRAPNLPERGKEELEVILHPQKSPCHHSRETHGLDSGIEDLTEKKAKAANIFVKAKKEIKAIIHNDKSEHHHHHKETHGRRDDIDENTPTNEVKGPNVFERVKEEFEAVFQDKSQHHHHKETHGRSDDIDENTPTNEVKGPNVFERVKEEFEAVFQGIHPKKES
ncbi:hypothetical protein SESBI_02089 [Sesbania bispinosa]|nr:hypothetical protein SESBI_02089 [Sesbania bispinosa]